MPTGSEVFLELPVALGLGPATGPTLKTALCHIRMLVGRRINNGNSRKLMNVCVLCDFVYVFLSARVCVLRMCVAHVCCVFMCVCVHNGCVSYLSC